MVFVVLKTGASLVSEWFVQYNEFLRSISLDDRSYIRFAIHSEVRGYQLNFFYGHVTFS